MDTGRTVKELRKEQHRPVINSQTVADDVELDEHGLSLRYPHALVLWLRCDQVNNSLPKCVKSLMRLHEIIKS